MGYTRLMHWVRGREIGTVDRFLEMLAHPLVCIVAPDSHWGCLQSPRLTTKVATTVSTEACPKDLWLT